METGRPSVATLVNMIVMQSELAGDLAANAPVIDADPIPSFTRTDGP
jgi:hypothetical protein